MREAHQAEKGRYQSDGNTCAKASVKAHPIFRQKRDQKPGGGQDIGRRFEEVDLEPDSERPEHIWRQG